METSALIAMWTALFRARPSLTKTLNNVSYLFVDRIVRLFVGVFVAVWTARYLGPERYGQYNYALAFVYLAYPLTTLGLDGIVIRDLVREPMSRGETLGTASLLRFAGSCLSLILCNTAIGLLRPDDYDMRLLVAITSMGPLFQTLDGIDLWFQSQVQARKSVFAKSTAFVIVTVLKIALIVRQAPLAAFALVSVVELAITAGALWVVYHVSGERMTAWRISMTRALQLLSVGWPLAISGFAVITYMKIDHVMLGEMLGAEAVGVYAAATRISELWYFIPMGIASSVFPLVVESKNLEPGTYHRRMRLLFDVMTLVAIGIAVPVALLSSHIVAFLYQGSFAAAGPILAIHVWASVFVFMGVAQTPWDAAEGLTKLAMFRTLGGAVVKIALNSLLLPPLGAAGAAVASLVACGWSAWLGNALDSRTWPMLRLQSESFLVYRHVMKYWKQ